MAHTKNHPNLKSQWIFTAIALLIIITFVSLYVNKAPSVGQAVSVGDTRWAGDTVNLEQEGTITFTVLPATRGEINFTIGNTVYDLLQEYNFTLIRLGTQSYQFILSQYPAIAGQRQTELARDLLFVGGAEDKSSIYLDDDVNPELEVVYQNNQVIVRNLHFVAPTTAMIKLQNITTDPTVIPPRTEVLPPVIQLVPGGTLLGNPYINASSIIAPEQVGAVIIGRETTSLTSGTPFQDTYLNFTTKSFTYTAPSSLNAVDIVVVNATVLGQVTKAYYVFVNGNIVYRFGQTGFPIITHWYSIAQPELQPLLLNVVFLSYTQLQPLALPCVNTSSFTTLFADKAVKRVYTYKDGAMQVWTNQSPANDFNTFTPFQGYFLELSGQTSFQVRNCPVRIVEPVTTLPSPDTSAPASLQISSGWTLFSLPGIMPRPLTEFTTDRTFQLYQCAQGQQGTACPEIDRSTLLNPGKPYWIKSSTGFTIQYRYRDIS